MNPNPRGLGPNSAGQSGDTQGISSLAGSSSESVEELMEEGQHREAGILEGIENSLEGDDDPYVLPSKEFPEDDIPLEEEDEDDDVNDDEKEETDDGPPRKV